MVARLQLEHLQRHLDVHLEFGVTERDLFGQRLAIDQESPEPAVRLSRGENHHLVATRLINVERKLQIVSDLRVAPLDVSISMEARDLDHLHLTGGRVRDLERFRLDEPAIVEGQAVGALRERGKVAWEPR